MRNQTIIKNMLKNLLPNKKTVKTSFLLFSRSKRTDKKKTIKEGTDKLKIMKKGTNTIRIMKKHRRMKLLPQLRSPLP